MRQGVGAASGGGTGRTWYLALPGHVNLSFSAFLGLSHCISKMGVRKRYREGKAPSTAASGSDLGPKELVR